jgi:hypothetical protein
MAKMSKPAKPATPKGKLTPASAAKIRAKASAMCK